MYVCSSDIYHSPIHRSIQGMRDGMRDGMEMRDGECGMGLQTGSEMEMAQPWE